MIRHAFTCRLGGNLADYVGDDPEAVARNRARLGVDPYRIAWMRQTHSTDIGRVDAPGPQVLDADGLVTAVPGQVLAVLVADCVPVLLADAASGVIAAVHAGRRGAQRGIVCNAVETMLELGAQAQTMRAWLGPAAGGASYQVSEQLAAEVDATLPGARIGERNLDLRAGIARQLRTLGVSDVDVDKHDTITSERYFSYRRSHTTGRQAGLIWIEEQP